MKVTPLITVALILCIACPGLTQAKKKPKPKFCIGKNGVEYAVGDGYIDTEGEVCIRYRCVKKKKKVFMKENKCIDGEWSDWSSWSACTATCGNATRTKERTCSNPPPSKGGNQCSGPDEEIQECSLPECRSLNDTVQALQAAVKTLQAQMQSMQSIGSCMSDLSSSDCPDSAPGKVGVVDGISNNTAGVTSAKADFNTNKAGISTNKADINTNKAGINTNKAGIMENKVAIAAHHGDWTIIQRRGQYGNAGDYFYKDFKDYENGFGSVDRELWIGLKKLAALTKDGEWELQVDLTDWDDKIYHAKYATFSVGPAPTYKLHVAEFKDGESTLGDSLAYHDGQAFSARDKDQDEYGGSCAAEHKGGWWYKKCHHANLNGLNSAEQNSYERGLSWLYGKSRGDNRKTWKASVMKIKRVKV